MLIYPVEADAEKWARDIASGKVSFRDAVRAVSIGPNAQEGGDLGFMALSDMAPGMMEQVSRMKKGDGDWVSLPVDTAVKAYGVSKDAASAILIGCLASMKKEQENKNDD